MLTGVVSGVEGEPLPGALITAARVADVPVDGVFKRTELGSVRSTATGKYQLPAGLSGLSKTAGDQATVSLELTIRVGNEERYSIVEVPTGVGAASTSKTALSASPTQVKADLTFGEGTSDAASSSAAGAVDTAAVSGDAVGPATLAAPSLTQSMAATASGTACPDLAPYWDWKATSETRTAYVPIQRVKTLSNSKQTYSWDKTSGTKLEVGYTGSGGSYASGGLVQSRINNSTVGIDMVLDYNQTRLLKVQWVYEKLQKVCTNDVNTLTYRLNVFRWQPKAITGGNLKSSSTVSWTCNRSRSTIFQNKTTVARTSSVTWTGSLTVAGVVLDSSSANNTSNTLIVNPKSTGARICGDNDYPADADRTQEVSK